LPQTEINRILIIRLSSLGDILLTTPIIRAMKKKYPSAKIDFVVRNDFVDAIKHNPFINKIYSYLKDNPVAVKKELVAQTYDLVFDLQDNWRSRILTNELKAPIHRIYKPTFKKLLLVWTKINLLKDSKSITQRYAESAGLTLDQSGLELFIPAGIKPNLFDGKKYIGFCPGAKHFTKRWPAENFIILGNELTKEGYTIVLFGGNSERELCNIISSKINDSINLRNDDQLLQLAADMKKCSLIVTNDSGLMHVASAVNVPVVAIFGSTVTEFGFSPYGVRNIILENKVLSCRPCSHIGRDDCPKKHFRCMIDIKPNFVQENIKEFISSL
jgi:lipopolysaccharide heptosyltransferase II